MEKLWAGCINGAVSHHSARALPWVLKDSVLEQATLVAVHTSWCGPSRYWRLSGRNLASEISLVH
jgi:hypothetical protein